MVAKIIPNFVALIVFFANVSGVFSSPSRDTLAPVWNLVPVPNPSSVKSILIDPNNAIYVAVWGEGILRSLNNGQNWTLLITGLGSLNVTGIDRDASGRLFVSTYGSGVFMSTNNGQVWVEISNGIPSKKVKAIKVKSPSTIFIGIEGYGIYRSTNLGTKWEEVNNGLWFYDINAIEIAENGSVLVGTNGQGLYYSADDGQSWRRVGYSKEMYYVTSFAKNSLGEIICGTFHGGVFSSVDNGVSWTLYKRSDTLTRVTAVSFAIDAEPIAGTDYMGIWRYDTRIREDWVMTNLRDVGVTALARNSQGVLFAGTSTGAIYTSTDGGSTWSSIRSSNNYISKFFSFEKTQFLVLNDNRMFRSTNYGLEWNAFVIPNMVITEFAADSSNRLFALAKATDTMISYVMVSTDVGDTWTVLLSKSDTIFNSIGIKNNTIFVGMKFQPADPRDPNAVTNGLLRSTDGGATWSILNVRARNTQGIISIGINKTGVVYLAMGDSIVKSTNDGNTWQGVRGRSIFNYRHFGFSKNSTIYVAGDFGFLSSTNEGTTWNTRFVGTFYQFLSSICVSPNDQIVFGGTYGGILTTVDDGASWDSVRFFYGFVRDQIQQLFADKDGYIWLVTPTSIYKTIDPQAISKVDLVKPPFNAIGEPLNTDFEWNSANNAVLYEMEISEDYEFLTVREKITFGKTNWKNVYPFDYNKLYYWRVRGRHNNALGEWSRVFALNTIVAPPVLISPLNKQGAVPLQPTFLWHQTEGSTGYILQVSKSSNFSNLVYEKQLTNEKDTSFTLPTKLEYYEKYYWRVAAKMGSKTSDWSEVWEFTTKLEAPKLKSPSNQASNVELVAILEWYPTKGGTLYEIQIALDPNFINKFYDGVSQFNDRFETKILEYFTKYYWRVRAANDDGVSDWSETWWFITTLQPVTLKSPSNNSKNLKAPVKLVWDLPLNYKYFQIQVSKDQNFNNTVVDDTTSDDNYTLNSLDYFTTYYWRVRVHYPPYESPWSDVFALTTTVASPKLLAPSNNSTNQPITVEFSWESVVGASAYEFVLSTDINFSSGIVKYETDLTATQIIVYNLEFSKQYFWKVRAKNIYGEGDWSETWNFETKEPSSVSTTESMDYTFFPNPTTNVVKFTFSDFKPNNVKVLNCLAQTLIEFDSSKFYSGELLVNFSNFEKGIYFVILEYNQKVILEKIIKE